MSIFYYYRYVPHIRYFILFPSTYFSNFNFTSKSIWTIEQKTLFYDSKSVIKALFNDLIVFDSYYEDVMW